MSTRIERFFTPTSELTQKLTKRIRDHSVHDLQGSIEAAGELKAENLNAKQRWTDLLKSGAERRPTQREIEADQRWLSEVLYGYLARLAQSQIQPENESFKAVEAIPAGMSSRLGLDDDQDLPLLEEMAMEFQKWLAGCEGFEFIAGWGRIWLDADDHQRFGLKKFPTPVEEESESDPRKSGKALSADAGSTQSWLAKILGT